MNARAILMREAAISALINGVLSIVFFLLVFGRTVPPGVHALGLDFLPQTFMVSLMGSLVPALILRRAVGGAVRPIVVRAVLFAIVATIVVGGSALAIVTSLGDGTVPVLPAVSIKTIFGATLGAIVTPLALRPLLRSESPA